jgi:hypothetical protein
MFNYRFHVEAEVASVEKAFMYCQLMSKQSSERRASECLPAAREHIVWNVKARWY